MATSKFASTRIPPSSKVESRAESPSTTSSRKADEATSTDGGDKDKLAYIVTVVVLAEPGTRCKEPGAK